MKRANESLYRSLRIKSNNCDRTLQTALGYLRDRAEASEEIGSRRKVRLGFFSAVIIICLEREVLSRRYKMKAFYMRISLIDRQTVANQRLAIDKEIERLGLRDKDFRIYMDECSGSIFQREGLEELIEDVRKKEVSEVIIWKWDRLGRSIKDLLNLVSFFEKRNVTFRSLTENTDTSTPAGRLLLHILFSFSEFERGLVSERTRLAMWNARKRGKQIGRPQGSRDKGYTYKRRSRGVKLGWQRRRAKAKRKPFSDNIDFNRDSMGADVGI